MFKKQISVDSSSEIISDDYENLGKTVKNFTSVENDLRDIGKCIDDLVATEDKQMSLNIMSEVRVKILQMQSSLKFFLEDVEGYLSKY